MIDDDRLVSLEGGYNARDLGGYPTTDGRHVRRGLVLRSATLAELTDADLDRLDGTLGVRLGIDLRSNREREKSPSRLRCEVWSRDYETSDADLVRALHDPSLSEDRAADLMRRSYRTLPKEQAPALAELFNRIADGHVPLIVHCAVGKDRTGVAAALLLAFLGVSHDLILDDYLASGSTIDRSILQVRAALDAGGIKVSEPALRAIIDVQPSYVEAMFDAITAEYGSIAAYVRDELAVSPETARSVRERLLE